MAKLSDEVAQVLHDFMSTSTEGHRKELDQYVHTCDLSFSTLNIANSSPSNFVTTHKDFIAALKLVLRAPLVTSEKELQRRIYDANSDHIRYNFQTFLVSVGVELMLVSPSRDALRENITKAQKLMATPVEMQIGHIALKDSGEVSSPARQKLGDLVTSLGNTNARLPKGIIGATNNAIMDLMRVHKNIHVSFNRNTKSIASWGIGETLLKGSIKVTLETIDSNLGKANLERRAVKKVRDLINTSSYKAKLAGLAKTDVLDDILAGLKGSKPKAKSSKVSETESTNSTALPKVNTSTYRFQDARGRFIGINVVSLQNLINGKLEEQLTSNMGKGGRKDILNYDTGNFSKTTKVTSISASRTEGIEVFYSYMKYRPGTGKQHAYDSFEPGNAQGLPLSRNPQLLVEKSIREIASSLVTGRLKATSI